MSSITAKEAAALLRQQDNILILTHRRPDGDTTGCAAGLCAALRQIGKTAYVLYNPEITDSNRGYVEPYWAPAEFQPDFVVSVDIAARSLFFAGEEKYLGQIGLAVDHHPSFEGFGAVHCVDDSRAACGEIVYEICRELGEITQEIALPLYAAVATDTGCFVYSITADRFFSPQSPMATAVPPVLPALFPFARSPHPEPLSARPFLSPCRPCPAPYIYFLRTDTVSLPP